MYTMYFCLNLLSLLLTFSQLSQFSGNALKGRCVLPAMEMRDPAYDDTELMYVIRRSLCGKNIGPASKYGAITDLLCRFDCMFGNDLSADVLFEKVLFFQEEAE